MFLLKRPSYTSITSSWFGWLVQHNAGLSVIFQSLKTLQIECQHEAFCFWEVTDSLYIARLVFLERICECAFLLKIFPYHSLLWSMRAAISLGWIIVGNNSVERTSQWQQEMLTAFERGRQWQLLKKGEEVARPATLWEPWGQPFLTHLSLFYINFIYLCLHLQ